MHLVFAGIQVLVMLLFIKLVHREVVSAVNGLVDFLGCERKRVPEKVFYDAERLECLLFSGYDPHFEGDEPPGL